MLSRRLRKSQPPRPCYRLPSAADKLKRGCIVAVTWTLLLVLEATDCEELWLVVSPLLCCCNCCCCHFIKPCSLSLWVPPAILSTPAVQCCWMQVHHMNIVGQSSTLIYPPQALLWLLEFHTNPTRLYYGLRTSLYLLLQHTSTSTRCRQLSKRHAALWKEQLKTFMYRMDSLRVAIMYYEHEMGGREIHSKI